MIFSDIEFIEPKDWNKRLTELNNGERARYFEYHYKTLSMPSVIVENLDLSDYQLAHARKVSYTVSIKEVDVHTDEEGDLDIFGKFITRGFNVIIKVTDNLDPLFGCIGDAGHELTQKIAGHRLNQFHSYKAKLTSYSKDEKELKITNQILKDEFGVQIELGDYVAYSGDSEVDIFKVEKFGIGTVEGKKPEKMVVIKTDNQNKKLGWC